MMVSRYKPVDIVRGSFRHRTKMFYSKVLITIQNVITIVLIATSLTIGLQIRHLISAPMGYNTADILDISTEIFPREKTDLRSSARSCCASRVSRPSPWAAVRPTTGQQQSRCSMAPTG